MKAVSASNGHITMFSWKSLPRCQPLSAFAEVVQRHHATGTPEMFAVGRNTKDTVTQEYEPTFGLYAQYCQKYDMSGTTIEFLFTDTRDARMATRTPGMGAAADGGTFEHYISMASPDAYSVCGQMLTNNTEHPTGVPMAYATPEQLRRLAKDFDNFDGTIDYNLDVGEAPAGPGPATTFGKATKSTTPNIGPPPVEPTAPTPISNHAPAANEHPDVANAEFLQMSARVSDAVLNGDDAGIIGAIKAAIVHGLGLMNSTERAQRVIEFGTTLPYYADLLDVDPETTFVFTPVDDADGTATPEQTAAHELSQRADHYALALGRHLLNAKMQHASKVVEYNARVLAAKIDGERFVSETATFEAEMKVYNSFNLKHTQTEQQQDVTEERVTAVTATTIAANTNRDEIDYFDGGWDWSQHDAETRRQLSINKWGGGEPDGYITNYLSYAEDVEHEMKTADTVDDTSTMDTAYISAMLGSLGSIGEPALPVPPPGYIGTWEEYMNEVCTYDDDLDINVDDTSKNRENLELAAARIITDITGAGTEEYHEEESLINAVADSLDKRLEMLGTDAPEPEKVEEFIAAAFAGRDPEYACSATSAETDPTFPEAISSPKRKEWIEACLTEWVSLTTTYKCFGTNVRPMREAVERTRRGERVRIIPLRWVLKMKPSRLKARLVACESVGRYNTPRLDKWSPTIGSDSVRMVFVIGCQHNCDFFSLDISGAYLTGKRPADEPDVYLTMPPGLDLIREYAEEHGIDLGEAKSLLNYKDANGKPNCLFLEGNLYGTQLAGRAFWEHARNWLVNDLGFKDATGDPCIFVKWMDDGSFIIVGLYVDDCLIATTSPETRRWFEQAFQDEFSQSPDSDGDTYLGIEYKVHELGNYKYVTLNTPRIWEKLRDKLDGLQITLPKVSTPLPSNAMDLVYADVDEVNNPLVKESEINVREILGMLSWGVHAVRPGEAFASSLIARRAHLPTRSLVVVLLHLTSYLLDHADDKLHITGNGERIFTTACDSSFANDQGHHGSGRSWFGFALIWGGIAFHFRSKLQPYVAPSTRDAEAGALVFCVKAMIGTLVMLEELGFLPEGVTPLRLEIDSQAAIASMTTEWIHKDSRWNAIRIRFLREFVREMLIKPFYTVTTEMRADALTKVPSSAHSHAIARLALMGTAPPPYSK